MNKKDGVTPGVYYFLRSTVYICKPFYWLFQVSNDTLSGVDSIVYGHESSCFHAQITSFDRSKIRFGRGKLEITSLSRYFIAVQLKMLTGDV